MIETNNTNLKIFIIIVLLNKIALHYTIVNLKNDYQTIYRNCIPVYLNLSCYSS